MDEIVFSGEKPSHSRRDRRQSGSRREGSQGRREALRRTTAGLARQRNPGLVEQAAEYAYGKAPLP